MEETENEKDHTEKEEKEIDIKKMKESFEKTEDQPDNFSDIEDSFDVNVNLVKNQTTTSNFKFNINVAMKGASKTDGFKNSDKFSKTGQSKNSKASENSKKSNNNKPMEEIKEKEKSEVKGINTSSNNNQSNSIENDNAKKILEGDKSSGSEYENDNPEEMQGDIVKKQEVSRPQTSDDSDSAICIYYASLRKKFEETGQLFEDPDFPCDPSIFAGEKENPEGEFEIEFERPNIEEDNIQFFQCEQHTNKENYNIEHEFKISRGLLNDKFFVGALLMLFRKKEEFFTNLVLDFKHANENIKAGFCGFTFFIDGEWKNVTIDTKLPAHQESEFSLSRSLCPKAPYWVSLFEKAYAKLFQSYTVLNNTLLKDFLVDFTGGWSKMIQINKNINKGDKDNKEAKTKIDSKMSKFYFDEITRCISQGYLIGCMNYNSTKIQEELNQSYSDNDDNEEEMILSNSLYSILDIQEYEGTKLIYLVNHWDKGKFTHAYGPEDETWEANKKLTEKLHYTVSTTDGTFWMLFDEFLLSFNTLYYCRIFPESWAQYTIPGIWVGESSGGSPQKEGVDWMPEQKIFAKGTGIAHKKSNIADQIVPKNKQTIKPKESLVLPPQQNVLASNKLNGSNPSSSSPPPQQYIQCDFKLNVIRDTEEAFFLNPQYKLEIKKGTKLIISLMQEDKKISQSSYIKCNFMIIYCKGKYSRVWDIKHHYIIKKALDEKDDGIRREIVMILDFNEIIKRFNNNNAKKLPKLDKIQVNLIPYMEYTAKYEIEKKNVQRTFKPYRPDAHYWLRIFSNEDIYISELKRPFENKVGGHWEDNISTGGPRFLIIKNKYVENQYWPINPQYMLKFSGNIRTKIILRKKAGHFSNEETPIGLLITKPSYYDEDKNHLEEAKNRAHQQIKKEKVKLNPIQRCIKSTDKILKTKAVNFEEIFPKLSLNASETVYQSSYCNNYCASIQKTFNKLDSPLILIPTLAAKDSPFEYEMKIYSTNPTELYPLYNDSCVCLISEWNEKNAGGSHLAYEEKDKNKNEDIFKRKKDWMDNPKFLLQFESKDWIKNLSFQIIISRIESIWKRRLSQSMINSMMSCYIFKYERDKWKENCMNKNLIDFMPKNNVILNYTEEKADPKGYILMPMTYAQDVYGPFSIMVKCNEKFTLTAFDENKK